MSQQTIGQGVGNVVPNTEKMKFLANGTVTKGDVVGFYLATLANGGPYTVDQCSATTIPPIGVAAETGTDVWIDVVVSGYCDCVTNDGTDVVAGDLLVGGAGVAVPTTAAEVEADASDATHVFGQSLVAETGTTCDCCIIYKRI